MRPEEWAIIVSAAAAVLYTVVTLWLACTTRKMAWATQATLLEMRRQFDLIHLPSLVLLVQNQDAAPHAGHSPRMTFRLTNVGGSAALFPRLWCNWTNPDIARVGRLHLDANAGGEPRPVTCAGGAVLDQRENAYFRLPMPPPDGQVTIEWKVSAGDGWQRSTWAVGPSRDAEAIWVASVSNADDGVSPFDNVPLVPPVPEQTFVGGRKPKGL